MMSTDTWNKIATRLHSRWNCVAIQQVTETKHGWLVLLTRERPTLQGFEHNGPEQRAMFFTHDGEEQSSVIV